MFLTIEVYILILFFLNKKYNYLYSEYSKF